MQTWPTLFVRKKSIVRSIIVHLKLYHDILELHAPNRKFIKTKLFGAV